MEGKTWICDTPTIKMVCTRISTRPRFWFLLHWKSGENLTTYITEQKIIAFLILNSWIYKFSRRKKNRKKNTGIFVGIYDLTQLLDVWIFPPLPFFVSWCIIRLPCTNFEVCMKLFKNWKTGSFPAESPNNPSKWKLFTMKTWIKEGSLRNSIHFYVTPSDKVKKAKCVRCFCDLL